MVFEKLRKIATWVSVYDRYGNVLLEPKTRFIKDLETSHIYSIFRYAEETGRCNLPKVIKWIMLKELEYRKEAAIKVGDKLTRLLAGTIPMEVVVGSVNDKTFKVGSADGMIPYTVGWEFDIKTGMEIDEDLSSGPEHGICVSYIKEIAERNA